MGRSAAASQSLKVLFRVLVLLAIVQFLIASSELSINIDRSMSTTLPKGRDFFVPRAKFAHVERLNSNHKVTRRKKHKNIKVDAKLDLNYTNKRRVPNGPDPIHNRKAGNSRRPPGQA